METEHRSPFLVTSNYQVILTLPENSKGLAWPIAFQRRQIAELELTVTYDYQGDRFSYDKMGYPTPIDGFYTIENLEVKRCADASSFSDLFLELRDRWRDLLCEYIVKHISIERIIQEKDILVTIPKSFIGESYLLKGRK